MRHPMKSFLALVSLAASLSFPVLNLSAQQTSSEREPKRHSYKYEPVAHMTKAVDYKQGSSSKIELRGTSLMPEVKGEAEIKTKTGTVEIEAELEHLNPANSIALSYLTYVLWAISPDG